MPRQHRTGAEVRSSTNGDIEVCITDDASTDPDAIEVGDVVRRRRGYASLHMQPVDVGNHATSSPPVAPCRGEYLMLLGNDDILLPGALEIITDDLRRVAAPVLLYSKQRINQDGTPAQDLAGTNPAEIAPGDSQRFATLRRSAGERSHLNVRVHRSNRRSP